ncbi:uncharacterized protein GGS25DRAFT_257192 [Hypoxylon fragiforme]|uniref:uncharacterized protein n=1 Tax=Hypoxylon fragiforme TaxID=63214 RepID=UPI0020C6109B|nr:uncharacterized protein GGS25DRAFT_257192 [Hypoxylon fragiforme]KAI2610356.1 hypothetical protein GGS25DRAFT_257192 [Hypoxylon fragiforme]
MTFDALGPRSLLPMLLLSLYTTSQDDILCLCLCLRFGRSNPVSYLSMVIRWQGVHTLALDLLTSCLSLLTSHLASRLTQSRPSSAEAGQRTLPCGR